MEQTNGGLIGFGTTICAIGTNIIPVETFIQTVVCAALGATIGFFVTYGWKKLTAWIESRPTKKTER